MIYTPVAKSHQAAAVAFLNESAFATRQWAIDKEILRRIEPIGVTSRVGNTQRSVLGNLLSCQRFARLVEQEALDGSAAYRPADRVASTIAVAINCGWGLSRFPGCTRRTRATPQLIVRAERPQHRGIHGES